MTTPCDKPALFTPHTVFEKALSLVKTNAAIDITPLQVVYGIDDVLEIVAAAQRKYETKRKGSKVRERLTAVSSRVMYYGHVLDVLSQHHPEYVSLAWGTMKFLFVLVLNHEETTSELAKAVANIGDVLPRARLQLDIFRVDSMKAAIERLYSDIITFLVMSLEWYEQGSIRRAWKAFAEPYKVRLKDLRDRIDESARRMDNLAHTLAQDKISKIHDVLLRLDANMNANHLVYLSRFSGLDRGQNEIQTDLILKTTGDTTLPDPVETLRFCRSIRRKRMLRHEIDREALFPTLENWSKGLRSSLVVLGGSGSTRFQTKDLATEMVELLQGAEKQVLWVLKGPRSENATDSVHTLLLKQLVNQAVQLNHRRVVGHISENFNAPRVAAARSESDWLKILCESLTGVSEIYLIIDMEALGYRPDDEASFWLGFFDSIQLFVQNVPGIAVKAAVVSFRQDFIHSVESASAKPLVVPLTRETKQAGFKVQKRQPWSKRREPRLRLH
ncbi:hypothetical protein DM02DRAFT_590081 [Periconia macrospinosa]|uniref:DUF7708 domain-containing protein n=1 Tax=Periconia macrospinosa TaxID=97972 RepID=A0A2V1DVJ8_9PLEO|nr:hypothetical protein DM02DRAFT_590081 [Periconia macrospinosa]